MKINFHRDIINVHEQLHVAVKTSSQKLR